MKTLKLIEYYKIFRLIFIIFSTSYFLGVIWYIYVTDLENEILNDPFDSSKGYKLTFKTKYFSEHHEIMDATVKLNHLVKVWYWAITTLSTIGFGDYSPTSYNERLWSLPILMFGVIIFSLIMGQFLEIIQYQNSIG